MKEIIDPRTVPPGGWRWTHPETKTVIHAGSVEQLFQAARRFLGNNNYPNPSDLNQSVIAQLDEAIQADMHERGLPPYPFLKDTEPPSMIQKIRNFAFASKQWLASGAPIVSLEELDRRQATCLGCQFWRGSSSFGMGSCGKCGCTGLKLYMRTQSCPAGKW